MNTHPLVPEDVRPDRSLGRSLIRAATATALASFGRADGDREAIVRRSWPADRAALRVVNRAAVDPADTSGWGEPVAGNLTAAFLTGLAPMSGAARLMQAGLRVSLDGPPWAFPYLDDPPEPAFIGEDGVIAASLPTRSHAELDARKIAAIITLTDDLRRRSPQDAETLFGTLLRETAAKSLDAAMFDNAAADADRPAGLLNGLTPLAAAPGDGVAALGEDLQALVDAIADAGGSANVWFFAAPGRALRLRLLAGAGLTEPVVGVRGLDPDSVVAVDVGGFVSGFSSDADISVGNQATLSMRDDPDEIVDSGGTPSSPVRSMFQTSSRALRLVLPISWGMRAPGLVQVVRNVGWN
jgi:hypothetical protein